MTVYKAKCAKNGYQKPILYPPQQKTPYLESWGGSGHSINKHKQAHRSQLTDNNPTDNSSVPGMDEVIDEKNAGQITEEIQDTGNVIKTESGPTHPLEASPPSPQFQCYYCEQRFPGQSELIAHMDKESADAREKRQLDGC
ncbi:MAG: hypothetical protein WAK17_10295 [Candidatus Nitrosopolaris sp.]